LETENTFAKNWPQIKIGFLLFADEFEHSVSSNCHDCVDPASRGNQQVDSTPEIALREIFLDFS